MNKKVEFTSSKSIDDLKAATLTYFQNQGFELVKESANSVEFKRGNILLNMVTFNPLQWKSSICIEFDGSSVTANFDVNSIFQVVTSEEEKLWETFISNYQKTVETGQSFLSENQSELKNTQKSFWKYIKYAVLGAIIFGITGAIIAYTTKFESLTMIGAISGALIFMIYKIKTDKD